VLVSENVVFRGDAGIQITDYCVCFENMGDSHKSSLGHGHQNRGHVVQVL